MRRPDAITLIAVWDFFCAVTALIGIGAIILIVFPLVSDLQGISRVSTFFGLYVGIFFIACYIAISVIAGIGILRGQDWGRILCIIQACLGMISVPIGTTIGILILVYLGKLEAKEYFAHSN